MDEQKPRLAPGESVVKIQTVPLSAAVIDGNGMGSAPTADRREMKQTPVFDDVPDPIRIFHFAAFSSHRTLTSAPSLFFDSVPACSAFRETCAGVMA